MDSSCLPENPRTQEEAYNQCCFVNVPRAEQKRKASKGILLAHQNLRVDHEIETQNAAVLGTKVSSLYLISWSSCLLSIFTKFIQYQNETQVYRQNSSTHVLSILGSRQSLYCWGRLLRIVTWIYFQGQTELPFLSLRHFRSKNKGCKIQRGTLRTVCKCLHLLDQALS